MDINEKRQVKKPTTGSTNHVRLNFKKKKDVEVSKSKIEEVIEEQPSFKKMSQPNDGSYLDKLHAKIERKSKKTTPVVICHSERIEVANIKKKSNLNATDKKNKALDLKADSLRNLIKPPQTIISLIKDEYNEIVSSENVVLSLRSIQISKRFSSSLAYSNVNKNDNNIQDLIDHVPSQKNSKVTELSITSKSDDKKSASNRRKSEQQHKLLDSELLDQSLSPEKDKKVRISEPAKFLKFSEFAESKDESPRRATSFQHDRLTFQGPPETHDKNFELNSNSKNRSTNNSNNNQLISIEEPTDFTDIFTPKGFNDPEEPLKQVYSGCQVEFEPDIFIKKIHSSENILESIQQKTFLDRKGVNVMDTQALFDSSHHLSNHELTNSNIFAHIENKGVIRPEINKASANFNHSYEHEYQTSNFNDESNQESEKELFANIHNLIERNYNGDNSIDEYRHKRPLYDLAYNKDHEEEPKSSVYTKKQQVNDESSANDHNDHPERMKRVITFANVHKLAKPTLEDEEFIRNYYANKDYPKAIEDEEDEIKNLMPDSASKDSLDIDNLHNEQDNGLYSVKSDRFNEDITKNPQVKFQSVSSKQVFDKAYKAPSHKVDNNVLNPVMLKNNNTMNFAQWEADYISKDTQEIDDNILDEINAIYKHTSKFNDEVYISEDSDNEKFNQQKLDKNVFLVASKDHSFDDEDGGLQFAANPDPEYFTLGRMIAKNVSVMNVDHLTAQMGANKDKADGNRPSRLIAHEEEDVQRSVPQPISDIRESEPLRDQRVTGVTKVNGVELGDYRPTFKKLSMQEFEDKFNDLIIKMLNKKARLIQRFWRSTRRSKPRDLVIADLFKEFVKIKRRNENFVRKNCDMKGVQTSNYSIKIIQKEFIAYLDNILYDAPNSAELTQLVGDLSLLIQKLGISGN